MSKTLPFAAGLILMQIGQTPLPGVEAQWLPWVKELGIPVMGIVILVMWMRRDKDGLAAEVKELRQQLVSALEGTIKDNTRAIDDLKAHVAKCPRRDE